MTAISEHFSLEELIFSETAQRLGLDNVPGPAEMVNLHRLAYFLETVRVLLGKPVMINSAYRSPLVNAAVGSASTSQHRLGCAADIRVPGMTPDEVVQTVMRSQLQFDQLIREFNSWTHISIPNTADAHARRQVLIIDRTGTRPYA
jgi:zinc D-Ala-D-Ala carboxypeptidase